MDTNLIPYDIDRFLNKYTRFMSKDIYISNTMYSNFLSQYAYLYQALVQTSLLYKNHSNYKQIMNIKDNKEKLIRFHNEKYLNNHINDYNAFFQALYHQDQLSLTKRKIICCEEEELLVVSHKENIPLITAKVKYLIEFKNLFENQILVLTSDESQVLPIKQEFQKKGLDSVSISSLREYEKINLLESTIVEEEIRYQILSSYLKEKIFPNKKNFEKLNFAFQNYIYLNKDYKDFDTFRDYHNYMYKRMFLSSKKSLKKFNEQEIKKRTMYLRTICNEFVNTKEEVDIANFLYLNSCLYFYDRKNSCFIVKNGTQTYQIFYKNELKEEEEQLRNANDFVLYAKYPNQNTYLEVLAYELIKRRYPMELRRDEEVYEQLKDTTIDSYFTELITKCFIPGILYYKKHHSFQNTKLTETQTSLLMEIYTFYEAYLKEHHFIEEEEVLKLVSNHLNQSSYRFLILLGDIPLKCQLPTLQVILNYQEYDLLKDNIQLSYDYKKYLYEQKRLPFYHVYQNTRELNTLTGKFLKENLGVINQKLSSMKSKISIYFYEDEKRLLVDKNMALLSDKILKNISLKESIWIGLLSKKDINHMIAATCFSKVDKSQVLTSQRRLASYGEIFKIQKNYDYILLPFLIMDKFHENLFKKEEFFHVKLALSVALSHARKNIFLLCPYSRKKELISSLGKLKNITIYS